MFPCLTSWLIYHSGYLSFSSSNANDITWYILSSPTNVIILRAIVQTRFYWLYIFCTFGWIFQLYKTNFLFSSLVYLVNYYKISSFSSKYFLFSLSLFLRALIFAMSSCLVLLREPCYVLYYYTSLVLLVYILCKI